MINSKTRQIFLDKDSILDKQTNISFHVFMSIKYKTYSSSLVSLRSKFINWRYNNELC